MRVDIENADDILVIHPIGKLDAVTTPEFQESVTAALNEGPSRVVFDMEDVPYISSAGLRVFIRAAKQTKGSKVAVCNLAPPVKQVFELAGFDKIMSLCDDLQAARQTV